MAIVNHTRIKNIEGDNVLQVVIIAGNPGVFQVYPYPYPPKPVPLPRVRVLTGRDPGFEGFDGSNRLTGTHPPAIINHT